ncbi:calcium-binding protein [Rhizobium sp. ARZ01]|uniref:calcium-binding protein n=1 Tax=Rhizobium sp. ARZ01 TaxID=2769313 RepID=UPI001AEEDAA9|nr:calcium-binding protein [Rhizobium sp. ARZ01]
MASQIITANIVGAGIQIQLASSEFAYVDSGVTVGATNNSCIVASGSNISLNIQGSVVGRYSSVILGTAADNDGNKLLIGENGSLRGFTTGLEIFGSENFIDNRGLIWGTYAAVLIYDAGGTTTITNSGVIEGERGIINAGNQITYLHNNGLLRSTNSKYAFDSDFNANDRIYNNGKIEGLVDLGDGDDVYDGRLGTIIGEIRAGGGIDTLYGGKGNEVMWGMDGADVLEGGAGNDVLDGGNGADRMKGGAGNDTYAVDDSGDTINETGGSGIDTVKSSISFSLAASAKVIGAFENLTLTGTADRAGTGNSLANILLGNNGKNALSGGAGNDRLYGNDGHDLLDGGLGIDALTGGAGNDTFLFNAKLGATNIDTITDFKVVDDTIRLENGIFTALTKTGGLAASAFLANTSGKAADAGDRIIYETDTGKLFYDADGTGKIAAVQFATLSKSLALTHGDFFII